MSTTRPIPHGPLPFELDHETPQALKLQVAEKLAKNRKQRGVPAANEAVSAADSPASPIAAAVGARYAQMQGYQEFFAFEAARAEAASELARRTAEAMAEAERALREEIEQWDARMADAAVTNFPLSEVEVSAAPEPVEMASIEAVVPEPEQPANLIEFPRQLVAARKLRPRLAEGPLLDERAQSPEVSQMRIFEVEPEQISAEPASATGLPEWSSIRLDAHAYTATSADAEMEISFAPVLEPASVEARAMSSLVDMSAVAAAFFCFVLAAAWASPELPTGKLALLCAAGAFFLLTVFYHLLFFTLGDRTPGMRYAGVELVDFEGEKPTRRAMRMRLLASVLSLCPMGVGYLWALLDEERLSWHDRIARIYQRAI